MRQTLTEQNQLFLNQLLGEHQLNEKWDLDWGASYGVVNADMPDRITNNLTENNAGTGYNYNSGGVTSNNRYFQNIDEDEIAGRAKLTYKFTEKDRLSVGYTGRS